MEEAILAEAYQQFLQARKVAPAPDGYPISFDLTARISERDWGPFISFMIEGDFRETTNLFNTWRRHLHDWEIWMGVVEAFGDSDAWTIRDHFIEPIVFYCMMKPSSTRDLLGTVATRAIHQANLQTIRDYPDRLDQDRAPTWPLSRRKKESQIVRIGENWRGAEKLMSDLIGLDSNEYRTLMLDFRNLASHAIAPRFEFGYTEIVVRSIVARAIRVQQGDGTFNFVADPVLKDVCYGFGGTPPLSLRSALSANKGEYNLAAQAFDSYQSLLTELMKSLPALPAPPSS